MTDPASLPNFPPPADEHPLRGRVLDVLQDLEVQPDIDADGDVTFTVTYRLDAVEKNGNQLVAHVGSDYGGVAKQQTVDQVVVNHGTIPLDDLYFELRPRSSNLGAVNYDELIEGKNQSVMRNPDGKYRLYRIGDAVAARNTHAAIYDALRLVKDI